MKRWLIVGGVVIVGVILLQASVRKSRPIPPRPQVSPVVAARNAEEQLLGVKQEFMALADAYGSTESGDPAENEATWNNLAAFFYWYLREAAPGSEASLYGLGTTPGRPKRLWHHVVPRGHRQKLRLADDALDAIPPLISKAVRERKASKIAGSPLLQDTRALFGRVGQGRRVTLLVVSDFEEQGGPIFRSASDAGSPAGWERGTRELPQPEVAPERVLTAHVQTRSGQTPGHTRSLLQVFERYFRFWGARSVFHEEW